MPWWRRNCLEAQEWGWPGQDAERTGVGRGWAPELGDDTCRGKPVTCLGPAHCPQDWTSGGQLCPSQLK